MNNGRDRQLTYCFQATARAPPQPKLNISNLAEVTLIHNTTPSSIHTLSALDLHIVLYFWRRYKHKTLMSPTST
ncbi:hypothetical protein DTO212C5_1820 [Paecilomyces variotii]|nr:hypothetical protein DTO212C5_1820 [Paecilomyces variotii]